MATETERLVVSLEARVAEFERSFRRANRSANDNWRAIEDRGRQASRRIERDAGTAAASVNRTMAGMASGLGRFALGGIAGGLGVAAIGRYSDAWIRVQNQLRVAGLEGDALSRTLDTLYGIAQRNGTAIEPLATLYGRVAQSQADLNATGADMIRFTEGVSLALQVAGSDAGQASGALLQLSQALGSAVVRSQEFNSINENARPILQAVANGLKEAGGSVSTLRALVVDGKVSSEAFFRAFLAGMGDLEAKAASTAQTSSQAFAKIGNAFARLIGQIDDTTKASAAFAEFMGRVANALDWATDRVGPLADKLRELQEATAIFQHLGFGGLVNGNWLGAVGTLFTATEALIERAKGIEADVRSLADPSAREPGDRVSIRTGDTVSLSDFKLPGKDDDDTVKQSRERVDSWQRETEAIQRRTEALRLEAEVLGMGTFEVEKARAAQALLNAAKQAGLEITPELADQVDELAMSYAQAAADLDNMIAAQDAARQAAEEFKGAAADIMSGFIADIRSGVSAADALANALNRVLDKLVEIGINSALDALFGGSGGILGGLFRRASGGIVERASGGIVRGPGSATSDSIPALLSNGEYVVNAAATRQHRALLEAINSGASLSRPASGIAAQAVGASQTVLTIRVDVDGARGNREIMDMVQSGVSAGLAQFNDYVLPGRVTVLTTQGLNSGAIR